MLRSLIYNNLLISLTKLCYYEVLSRLPMKSRLLDIGIGTGKALIKNKNIIIQKNLKIIGIDINGDYLKAGQKLIDEQHLENYVNLQEISFYDYKGGPFDAIYFSSSFMLLPDQHKALQRAKELLAENGKIYFTQTLHFGRNRFMEMLKPKLIYLTSVDFGKITYEQDFLDLLKKAGLSVTEYTPIKTWRRSGEQLIACAVS